MVDTEPTMDIPFDFGPWDVPQDDEDLPDAPEVSAKRGIEETRATDSKDPQGSSNATTTQKRNQRKSAGKQRLAQEVAKAKEAKKKADAN